MELSTSQRWHNPPEGGGASVPAGNTIELSYPVKNTSTERPIEFSLEIDGLPPEWLADNPSKRMIAPDSEGEAVIAISPDYDATQGVATFNVMLRRRGAAEWPAPRRLNLKVTAPTGPRPEPPEPEFVPEPEPAPAVAAVVIEDVPVVQTEPTPVPTQAAEPVVEAKSEPVPEAKPEPTVVKEGPKRASGVTRKAAPPKPEPEAEPEPELPKAPEEPQLRVVDDFVPAAQEPEVTPEPVFVASDRTVVDPSDGAIIQARPGERVLVKFSVPYPVAAGALAPAKTAVLQEDQTLDRKWIDVVADQVAVLANGVAEVALLLTPSLDADPASYPFSIAKGFSGEPLASSNLILEVQPMPAVALAAEGTPPKVWIRAQIPLAVSVSTAGNAETAYRLAVRAPEAEEEVPLGKYPLEISETPTWRYVIERELGSLESPVIGQRPPAQSHKLWLRRKGIWWFGFKESHTFKLAAVPVTDARNGQKPGNSVELTGTRYRPWPIPLFFLIPLLFILWVFVSQGPHNLTVTNAMSGASDQLFVLSKNYVDLKAGSLKVPVELKWDKGFLPSSVTRTEIEQNGHNEPTTSVSGSTDTVDLAGYRRTFDYRLGNEVLSVKVVGLRSNGLLGFAVSPTGENGSFRPMTPTAGSSPQEYDATLNVPAGGSLSLAFGNNDTTSSYTLYLYELGRPPDSKFQINNFEDISQNEVQIAGSDTRIAKIVAKGNPGDTATWKLISTDAKYPILNLNLKIVGAQ